MAIQTCVICGKEFEPHHWKQKACSEECQIELQKQGWRREQQKRKTKDICFTHKEQCCEICGNIINPASKRKKYCSSDCAKIAAHKRSIQANKTAKKPKPKPKPVPKKPKIDSFDATLREMTEYNIKHGTRLDYGAFMRLKESGKL